MPGSRVAGEEPPTEEFIRQAEAALRRLGYEKVGRESGAAATPPQFWVQESGVPRRRLPVWVPGMGQGAVAEWDRIRQGLSAAPHRGIMVVGDDHTAEEAFRRVRQPPGGSVANELGILVVPPAAGSTPHWHEGIVEPRDILPLATGIVVGLFRRAQKMEGSTEIDFEEMLGLLRQRFHLDVVRSLGVRSEADALFVLYQMAQRYAYAPGDPGANLHTLVLKPTGPAARTPWFAA